MPKLTRKFPTVKKTTTIEGRREYAKFMQREYRERKKTELEALKQRIKELEKVTSAAQR